PALCTVSLHDALPILIVDRGRCCGYGLCAQLCPEVYKLDENGLVYVESELIPGGLEEGAREGAAACPAEALVIEAIQSCLAGGQQGLPSAGAGASRGWLWPMPRSARQRCL